MEIAEYLDSARAKLGDLSDYKLSQALGINRSQISAVRKKERCLPNHAEQITEDFVFTPREKADRRRVFDLMQR